MMPAIERADPSGAFGRRHRAPGWPAADGMTVAHPGDLTSLTTGQLATHLAARQPIQSASFTGVDWNELPAEDAILLEGLGIGVHPEPS